MRCIKKADYANSIRLSMQQTHLRSRTYKLAVGFLLTIFAAWAVVYSVVTPLWEAPDEPDDFAYSAFLRHNAALHVQVVGGLSMTHHPPLYYALAAIAMLPADLSDRSGEIGRAHV